MLQETGYTMAENIFYSNSNILPIYKYGRGICDLCFLGAK